MFEAFYQKYLNQCLNKELHAKYFKGSDKLETLFSILVILSASGVVLSAILRETQIGAVFMLPYLLFFALFIQRVYCNNKEIQKALSDYQSVDDVYKRIKILENLLKHPKFGLYNIDGVEYLSKCCELELGQLKEDRMGLAHILLTLVSALLGGIANNTELSQILILAFGTAIVLVIILIIYWYRESSARTSQRKAYAILQQDLAYVRYQIQTSALKPTIYLPASSRNKKLPRRR